MTKKEGKRERRERGQAVRTGHVAPSVCSQCLYKISSEKAVGV